MKKNKTLRLASALLVLVLLTTSVIGGTFAKYTTTGSVTDTARVAKWGVVITTSGTLYSDAYAISTAADDKGNLPTAWTNTPAANAITVASSAAKDNIVAPGTKSYGNGMSFGISGTPEVAVTVSTTIKAEDIFLKAGTYGVLVPAKVSDLESLNKAIKTSKIYKKTDNTYAKLSSDESNYVADSYFVLTNEVTLDADYFPVEYTLGGTTKNEEADAPKTAVKIADVLAKAVKSDASADTGKTDYKAAYTGISDSYAANTDLGEAGPKFKDENLKWEWKLENTNMDPADTLLGDLIAARGDTAITHKFVSIADDGAVTELAIQTGDDYTVKSGTDVVANLRTSFDISLEVTQID